MFQSSRSSTDGDAPARVPHVLGHARPRVRRVEAPARFLRDPPQRRRVHRRVEVFGVARAGPHEGEPLPTDLLPARAASTATSYAPAWY